MTTEDISESRIPLDRVVLAKKRGGIGIERLRNIGEAAHYLANAVGGQRQDDIVRVVKVRLGEASITPTAETIARATGALIHFLHDEKLLAGDAPIAMPTRGRGH
jgi:hypothetical protein